MSVLPLLIKKGFGRISPSPSLEKLFRAAIRCPNHPGKMQERLLAEIRERLTKRDLTKCP